MNHRHQLPVKHLRFAAHSLVVALSITAAAEAQSRTYTSDADFDEGILFNVNHLAPNSNQLQLNTEATLVSTLSVACGGTGTLVRIDTSSCEVVGEYRTAPQGYDRDPSRATVDLLGDAWVGNRVEAGEGGETFGSVAKFGVVMGGTRVNADGTPNSNGDFLAPPFAYSTAVDRDGDGLIRTSRGLGDVLAWPDVTDGLGGGDARVEDSLDEAILIFQRTTPERVRHLAIDSANNLWAGGYPTFPTSFDYIDGSSGQVLQNLTAVPPGCGGYAGLVDNAGVLWSTSELEAQVIRYDGNGPAICIDVQSNVRGIAVAPDGNLWTAGGTQIAKVSPDGGTVSLLSVPGSAQLHGIAIDQVDGSIWVASSGTDQVIRLDSNGNVTATVTTDSQPRGVAIDEDGFVWVANQGGDSVQRVNPSSNAVVKTIQLQPGSQPYNPSHMTGVVAATNTLPAGEWSVIRDGGEDNVSWNNVSWNASVPRAASLDVFVRAANDIGALQSQAWTFVTNNAGLDQAGRFLELRVDLARSSLTGQSPILFDLTVSGQGPVDPGDCSTVNRRQAGSLLVYPEFDNQTGSCTVLTLTNTSLDSQTLAVEFVYIDGDTCSEFNRVEHLTPNDTLTVFTKLHNPQHSRGFAYVFVKDPVTGDPIVANSLIGSLLIMNGLAESTSSIAYGINALPFEGLGRGGYTDIDGDGLRDLDGLEYSQAPGSILIPRYIGQGVTSALGQRALPLLVESELLLLSLSGGSQFTTTLDFIIYNDNEQGFSSEYTFYCWEKVNLLDISNAFSIDFLRNYTNHDPDEIHGANLESGWMRIDGAVASSSSTSIADPAFYATLIEKINSFTVHSKSGADLPFELCSQPGVLLPRDLTGGL